MTGRIAGRVTGRTTTSGARRSGRRSRVVLLGVALTAVAACTTSGPGGTTGPADVTGVVGPDAAVNGGGAALTDASDDYYEGLALTGDDLVVVDADGTEVGEDTLVPGTAVEVWVADFCEESYPVQCDVEAVRLAG